MCKPKANLVLIFGTNLYVRKLFANLITNLHAQTAWQIIYKSGDCKLSANLVVKFATSFACLQISAKSNFSPSERPNRTNSEVNHSPLPSGYTAPTITTGSRNTSRSFGVSGVTSSCSSKSKKKTSGFVGQLRT